MGQFGEFLKKLREDRGMTLRDVEEKIHISNAYLSQVESGQRNIPTMRILSKLAEVYGCNVDALTTSLSCGTIEFLPMVFKNFATSSSFIFNLGRL